MKTLKTFEEFNWFKRKELTPEEEYRKQEEEARKEREEIFNKGIEKEEPYRSKRVPSPAVRTSTVGGEEEEYVRPTRHIQNQKIKTKDVHLKKFNSKSWVKNMVNDPWGEENWE
jgi:hypothetical protein